VVFATAGAATLSRPAPVRAAQATSVVIRRT